MALIYAMFGWAVVGVAAVSVAVALVMRHRLKKRIAMLERDLDINLRHGMKAMSREEINRRFGKLK